MPFFLPHWRSGIWKPMSRAAPCHFLRQSIHRRRHRVGCRPQAWRWSRSYARTKLNGDHRRSSKSSPMRRPAPPVPAASAGVGAAVSLHIHLSEIDIHPQNAINYDGTILTRCTKVRRFTNCASGAMPIVQLHSHFVLIWSDNCDIRTITVR